jgi:hypothetical protein
MLALVFLQQQNERRVSTRFPIEREIRYRQLYLGHAKEGTGSSVNISSRGILFTTDEYLKPGTSLEVIVSWPVLLDADFPMSLVTFGRVVRSQGNQAAIEIQRYEFRSG